MNELVIPKVNLVRRGCACGWSGVASDLLLGGCCPACSAPPELGEHYNVPGYAARRCDRCEGCGKVASGEEGAPWVRWLAIPPESRLAVTLGVVEPLPCPACGGVGQTLEPVRVAPVGMSPLAHAVTGLHKRLDRLDHKLAAIRAWAMDHSRELSHDEGRGRLQDLIARLDELDS